MAELVKIQTFQNVNVLPLQVARRLKCFDGLEVNANDTKFISMLQSDFERDLFQVLGRKEEEEEEKQIDYTNETLFKLYKQLIKYPIYKASWSKEAKARLLASEEFLKELKTYCTSQGIGRHGLNWFQMFGYLKEGKQKKFFDCVMVLSDEISNQLLKFMIDSLINIFQKYEL